MGMLFNSPATVEMLAKVNHSFGPGNISRWRKPKRLAYFAPTGSGQQKLHDIVDSESIYPDSGSDGSEGTSWTNWLTHLSTITQSGGLANVGDDVRSYIYNSLSTNKCKEIIFVVVPSDSDDVTTSAVTFPSQPGNGPFATIITIRTATVASIMAMKRRLAAQRKKAKSKKAKSKKKR